VIKGQRVVPSYWWV